LGRFFVKKEGSLFYVLLKWILGVKSPENQ